MAPAPIRADRISRTRRQHRRDGREKHHQCLLVNKGEPVIQLQIMNTNTLTPDMLQKTDAYWRAANYLSVGQMYLTDQPPDEDNALDEVADFTIRCLLPTVPAAVPGIAFLSGGQSAELASARLNAMNLRFKSRAPWGLAFSFARAIRQPALEIWQGQEENVLNAQNALLHRARCNQAARRGEYDSVMERTGA